MKYTWNLQELGISPQDKILIIFPHPDDESAFCAGLMQKLVKSQIDFKLVILTKGESSTLKYGLSEGDLLEEVREKELEKAMKILGVKKYHLCGFSDGKLTQSLLLKDYVSQEILDYQPTFVVTYEPSGVYGHPDHVYLTKLIQNFQKSGGKYQILYATVSPHYVPSKASLKMASDPSKICPLKPQVGLVLTPVQIWKKFKAVTSHRSQGLVTGREAFRRFYNGLWWAEYFTKGPLVR